MLLVRLCAAMALLGIAFGASSAMAQKKPAAGPVPVAAANPQPSADKLKPGLEVSYFYGLINYVNLIPDAKGKPGAALPNLDYNVGFGKVLTSEQDDGVQARILGFIKLDKPGVWKFAVNSNDGVRLTISGKKIYELPGVQPDVMSDVLEVNADAAGWYPIKIMYFEKRNTSTLQLFWAAPGASDLAIVPVGSFAHIPE